MHILVTFENWELYSNEQQEVQKKTEFHNYSVNHTTYSHKVQTNDE